MLMAMIAVSDSFVNSNFQDETIRIPLQKWGLGQKWGPVNPLRPAKIATYYGSNTITIVGGPQKRKLLS